MLTNLREAWKANQSKNELSREENKAKAKLEEEMVKAGVNKVAETIGNRLIVATVESREEDFIDPVVFRALVSDAEFMKAVQITKATAEAVLGKAPAKACLARKLTAAKLRIAVGEDE